MGWNRFANCSISGVPLGLWVRKQFAKTWIFRVRKGNGVFGTIQGSLYQDKYTYFIPTSITNTQSQPVRALFAQAVENWQTSLTQEEKLLYNRKSYGRHMSGYNLYIREYILDNI